MAASDPAVPPKVCSLHVRPIQCSDLTFSSSGIIASHNATLAGLGARVVNNQSNVDTIYANLGQKVSTDPGRFFYDADAITAALGPWTLYSLRAQQLAAALEKAIALRKIAYLRKYKNGGTIANAISAVHNPTNGTKAAAINALQTAITAQHRDLAAAYANDARLGVVRETVSQSRGNALGTIRSTSSATTQNGGTVTTTSSGTSQARETSASNSISEASTSSSSSTTATPIAMVSRAAPGASVTTNPPAGSPYAEFIVPDPAHNHSMMVLGVATANGVPAAPTKNSDWQLTQQWVSEDTVSVPFQPDGSGGWKESSAKFTAQQTQTDGSESGKSKMSVYSTMDGVSQGQAVSTATGDTQTGATSRARSVEQSSQSVASRGYDYRHPSAENEARYQRTSADLLEELLSESIAAQQVPDLQAIFDAELEAIDTDVRALQVAFLETILTSPLPGVVSVVYKDVGEAVRAGEPVIRVENDAQVLIIGTIQYRGQLVPNKSVTITTNFFGSGTQTVINGTVAAVRGHKAEEDEWEVVFQCENHDSNGNPILPLNYNFDWDDTTLAFS